MSKISSTKVLDILVDQYFPICYNNGMERKKHSGFELLKNTVFGDSKVVETVDTNTLICYNNNMLKQQHVL